MHCDYWGSLYRKKVEIIKSKCASSYKQIKWVLKIPQSIKGWNVNLEMG